MQERRLRIVKPPLPAIGICERCNSQFKSSKVSQSDAENEIKAAFDAHQCKLMDDSQNARRIVRESSKDP
jgi:Holliday junction resolvase RusA-like endonuclease